MSHPGFVVEFNNSSANGRKFGRHFRGLDLAPRQLSHKTGWPIKYDGKFESFSEFKPVIAAAIRANGTALIVSLRTRTAWVMGSLARRVRIVW